VCAALSCDVQRGLLPIETGFGFTNLSRTQYAALGIRQHAASGAEQTAFHLTALLPPGATTRVRFLEALGEACPDALDFRIFIYLRTNRDVPIGLDPGEQVDPEPVAAGEVLGVPACSVQPLETYTIVNWDAPAGEARVKFAQATPVETAIRSAGLFPNADAVWESQGADPDLARTAPPALADPAPIAGHVLSPTGAPWEGVVVVLRTRFRVRADDGDPANDPDSGFGEPIDFVLTDANGAFQFDRPPGAYRVEVFSDDLVFQPASVDVEVPQSSLVFIAEPGP
jgi:hypothetical protein